MSRIRSSDKSRQRTSITIINVALASLGATLLPENDTAEFKHQAVSALEILEISFSHN